MLDVTQERAGLQEALVSYRVKLNHIPKSISTSKQVLDKRQSQLMNSREKILGLGAIEGSVTTTVTEMKDRLECLQKESEWLLQGKAHHATLSKALEKEKASLEDTIRHIESESVEVRLRNEKERAEAVIQDRLQKEASSDFIFIKEEISTLEMKTGSLTAKMQALQEKEREVEKVCTLLQDILRFKREETDLQQQLNHTSGIQQLVSAHELKIQSETQNATKWKDNFILNAGPLNDVYENENKKLQVEIAGKEFQSKSSPLNILPEVDSVVMEESKKKKKPATYRKKRRSSLKEKATVNPPVFKRKMATRTSRKGKSASTSSNIDMFDETSFYD